MWRGIIFSHVFISNSTISFPISQSTHSVELDFLLFKTPKQQMFCWYPTKTRPNAGCAYLWWWLWTVLVLWCCSSLYGGTRCTAAQVPDLAVCRMSLAFSSCWLCHHYHPFSGTHGAISEYKRKIPGFFTLYIKLLPHHIMEDQLPAIKRKVQRVPLHLHRCFPNRFESQTFWSRQICGRRKEYSHMSSKFP